MNSGTQIGTRFENVLRLSLVAGIGIVASPPLSAIGPEEALAKLTISHWGAQNGIPEETFAGLLAPGDGYVWLASNHGLVRFDGHQAQVFRLGDLFRAKGTGSCSSSTLGSIVLAEDGNIWAGSGSGCIFQLRRDRFGGFANFRVFGMESPAIERDNAAVIALRKISGSAQIEVVRRSRISAIDTRATNQLPLQPPAANASAERESIAAPAGLRIQQTSRAADGTLWALVDDGQLYSLPAGATAWVPRVRWAGTTGATPFRLLATRDGSIWIASSQGLFHWKGGAVRHLTAPGKLPQQQILAIHEDRGGCLWLGMPQAAGRLCGDRMESIRLGVEQEEMIATIDEDPQGNIWLAGRWGNLYRLSHPIFQIFTRREGMPESHFTGVTTDRNGDIWGSTRESGLVRIVSDRVTPVPPLPSVAETQAILGHPAGGVLAATARGIFHADGLATRAIPVRGPILYRGLAALFWADATTALYSNSNANFRLRVNSGAAPWTSEEIAGPTRIRQWTRDPTGRIWALAQFAGLHYLEGGTYLPAQNGNPAKARAWYSLVSDKAGLLWIGTTDGIEIYSPAENRFLTGQPLLFGDQIFHISEDQFGKIWCATRQGLVRFSRAKALGAAAGGPPDRFFVERFGDAQALPTTNFGLVTSATGTTSPDGRIWFPGLLGLVSAQPADFERIPRAPKAALLQFTADGAKQDVNLPLLIPPGSKTVEFLFQTLRLDPLGGDFCRVKLEGFDPGWTACNESRTQQYTSLPPGKYEFVVQTSSQGGVWNGAELRAELSMEPAFHELAWVRLLALFLLVSGLGLAVWSRQKQLLERTRWLEEKVEERTSTLAQATNAAESANRAKTEFLATMSHEIRTPMNGVLGAVQILDESPLNWEQKKLVSVIRQSGEDLVGIVDDILSLAKVEAGKLTLERTPVHLQSLGESLVALFRPKGDTKGIALTYLPAADLPKYILSDPQRIRQILLNLLGNAVKFTSEGEVRLRASADPEQGKIHFRVEDTGSGIPPEVLPTLFEPFVQADSSTTRRFGGSGLGLSIVRRFVDAMGGSVSVESELGKGSIFYITLPYEATPDGGAEPIQSPPPILESGTGLTVLLVEDNQVNQMISQKMLCRLGCAVVVANHGREALRSLRDAKVDLVLMDCQMPELDGYETTRAIRAWGGLFQHLPVIALTASAMEEDRQRCLDAGMNDFLSKPLMLTALAAALARWHPNRPAESAPVFSPPSNSR